MKIFNRNNGLVLKIIIVFFLMQSQHYNVDVQAKIEILKEEDNVTIKAFSLNKKITKQELRYSLKVFKTEEKGNKSNNEQSGRFVISANEQKLMSQTTINVNKSSKVIVLLLVYNLNDQIIGKDRIEINGDENEIDVKRSLLNKITKTETNQEEDVSSSKKDGVEISGLIVEETKTKPGRDFYTIFYNLYNRNNLNGAEIVTIKEIVAIGRNTKIEVRVGRSKIFEFFVRPSSDYLTKMGDVSLIKVNRYFNKRKMQEGITRKY